MLIFCTKSVTGDTLFKIVEWLLTESPVSPFAPGSPFSPCKCRKQPNINLSTNYRPVIVKNNFQMVESLDEEMSSKEKTEKMSLKSMIHLHFPSLKYQSRGPILSIFSALMQLKCSFEEME